MTMGRTGYYFIAAIAWRGSLRTSDGRLQFQLVHVRTAEIEAACQRQPQRADLRKLNGLSRVR
jgi:hypothetical protein